MAEDKSGKSVDNSDVDERHVIPVAFEDLSVEDQKAIELEFQREVEESRKKKLACYQKTRGGIVKKADTASISLTKVSSLPITPEELAQFVDISVASKYGADLEQMTRMVTDSVRSSFDRFKSEFRQDAENSLPRQVRSVVQQVLDEVQGKRGEVAAPDNNTAAVHSPSVNPARVAIRDSSVNFNLQQPFYQTMAYGPSLPPTGNGNPHGPVPDTFFPKVPAMATPIRTDLANNGDMSENVREKVARTLREFGFEPKGRARSYQKPYPEFF